MGYSPPKKQLDLKDFLSKKGTPRRTGWQNRKAAVARAPAQGSVANPITKAAPPKD